MFPRKDKQQDRDQIWDIRCPLFQGGNKIMRVLLNKAERSTVAYKVFSY